MVFTGDYVDVTISDGTTPLPFTYAINDDRPYIRQTSDFKRQQIDTSQEPGEQSLSQWWVRAQDSWHRGQGIQNYDPGSNHETEYRFTYGTGVNPWVQGQVTNSLALSPAASGIGGSTYCGTATYFGTTWVFFTDAIGHTFRYNPAVGGTATQLTNPNGAAGEPAFAGDTMLWGTIGLGFIYGTTTNPGTATSMSILWTGGPTGSSLVLQPYWVKGRILVTLGPMMYELTLAGGTFPATPTFTSPINNGVFTAVAEAPDCILASLNANGKGYIYRIGLVEGTTAGSSPTLGAWTQVAEMPPGEEINAMKTYLGSYVALGTTMGVRICDLGQNGQMTFGPLTIEGAQCYSLAARNHYVFAGVNDATTGLASIARIDLGQEILNYTNTGYASKTLRYAYNYDISLTGTTTTNKVTSVAPLANVDGAMMAVFSKGVYFQSTSYQTGGTFTTGRIRYGTTEPKSFCYLRLSATVPSGTSIVISAFSGNDPTERTVATVTSSTNLSDDIIFPVAIRNTPMSFLTLKFVLNGTSSATPNIDSFSVKAAPLPHLQRQIQLPLRLADFEQDRQGNKSGYDGSAFARLAALEAYEQKQTLLTFVDNTNGETYTGVIQRLQFTRDTPTSRNATNFGGILTLTVLKI